MTTPAITRDWDYTRNYGGFMDWASVGNTNDNLHLYLINKLTAWDPNGTGLAPKITSSCDSVTAHNNDDVNLITDTTKIVHSSAAARSWWVYDFPGIGLQLCFSMNVAASQSCTIVASPTGFGAANGGADGTTLARPTATVEFLLCSLTVWVPFTASGTGSTLNIWRSKDQEAVRIVIMSPSQNQGGMLLLLEKSSNPVPGWSNPAIAYHDYSLSGVAIRGNLYSSGTGAFFYESTIGAGRMELISMDPDLVLGANSINGEIACIPMIMGSASAGFQGPWGEIADWYWAATGVPTGYILRDSGHNPAFVCIDDMYFPWTGDTKLASFNG